MHWSESERRTLLNLFCRVARADGVLDDAEIDHLSELFSALGEGVLSVDEINAWLEDGPPPPEALLPVEAEPLFLEQARVIMGADGEIIPTESALVRALLRDHFRR